MRAIAMIFSLLVAVPLFAQTPAARGDINLDGSVNTSDVEALTDYLLAAGTAPARNCSADVNADTAVTSLDALRLIDFVVAGGQGPASYPSETCDGDDNDCDGTADEDYDLMTDVSNCGQCGTICASTNSLNTCSAGVCTPICNTGWASCDGNGPNGCETLLNSNPACTSAQYVGTIAGDAGNQTINVQGRGERWVRFRLEETSNSVVNLRARITLAVPPNVNYDLFAFNACGASIRTSSTTSGDEVFSIEEEDSVFGGNDSIDVYIEIRFASGSACNDWALTIRGNTL